MSAPAMPSNCEIFLERLPSMLAGTSEAELDTHLSVCEGCRQAAADLRQAWDMFRELPALEPPEELHQRTRARVLAAIAEDQAPVRAVSPAAVALAATSWRELLRVPLAITSALIVSGAVLSLLGGLIWGSSLSHGHMFFCAAIFAGLLVGAFSWIYGATAVNGLQLDVAARVGLLSLAITVVATTSCPEIHVLSWWERSWPGQLLTHWIGAGGSSLVFGFGYGLMPGFLAMLASGRLLAERPIANGLLAAGVVFLLALPVIYLQSAPFTFGLIASWVAGTAAGTLCGVFGALRVRRPISSPSPA